jgi:hypothetical protein
MKSWLITSIVLLLTQSLPAGDTLPAVVRKEGVHTWENVGEITKIAGKTFTLRRTLRLSEATWSLLPGAVSNPSQLQQGDRIHAKGSTLGDGIYDTRRIFLISTVTPHSSHETETSRAQGADFGGPDARDPTRGLGYPEGAGMDGQGRARPGLGGRIPPAGQPRGAGTPSPVGLENSQSAVHPRFLPGDVEGIVEEVKASELILSQTIVFGRKTVIRGKSGETANEKALQIGARVAVTIRDEVDEESMARKATVIRVLP